MEKVFLELVYFIAMANMSMTQWEHCISVLSIVRHSLDDADTLFEQVTMNS